MFQEQSRNNSLLHRLNPTLKFISFVFIIIMIFLPLGFFAQTILLVILLSLFLVARIKRKVLWSIIKSVIFLFLILFFINWFLYKTPIAVNIGSWDIFSGKNGLIFGNRNWITDSSFLSYNQNGLLISQIWGGQVGIGNTSYIPFDKNIIDQIVADNHFDQALIDKLWQTLENKHSIIKGVFLKAFNDDAATAAKYYYLINNSFTYNGMVFDPVAVKEAMWYQDFLKAINNNQALNWDSSTAQQFLASSYYVVSTNWYTLSPLAIQLALFVSIKVFLMIMAATLLTTTTNSIELTYALENVLSPLKLLKLPVAEASMMIAIALRFIPSLLSESNRIMNAQASRGVDFQNGKFNDKIKAIVSLVVPLFSIAFKKAEELANAMDARSYNPRYARTKYRKFIVHWYDWVAYFFLMLLLGFFIAICKWKLLFTPFNLFELGIIA